MRLTKGHTTALSAREERKVHSKIPGENALLFMSLTWEAQKTWPRNPGHLLLPHWRGQSHRAQGNAQTQLSRKARPSRVNVLGHTGRICSNVCCSVSGVCVLSFPFLLSSFIPLWSENTHCIILLSHIYWGLLFFLICEIFWKRFPALLKRMCFSVWVNALWMSIKSIWFVTSIPLLMFISHALPASLDRRRVVR